MRLRDYPEVIVDEIPKLYESHIKVIITHLYGIEEKVERLPKQFCKMYTTQPLANQLLQYLRSRDATILKQDFHIVKEGQPFKLRLSDGKRLEAMLCAGNELGSSLMLLVRKLHGGRLLYYYSAVQQDELWRLMGNVTYQEWIAQGAEVLCLNLKAAEQPFEHVDFEELAKTISKYGKTEAPIVLRVPLLGYEYLIRRLAQTLTLHGQMKLLFPYLDSYSCLSSDQRCFQLPGYKVKVHVAAEGSAESVAQENLFPLEKLKWSPLPTRMNLTQLCSLLRPQHINGIVAFHGSGNVPSVPQYLKRFRLQNSPRPAAALAEEQTQVPETQVPESHLEEIPSRSQVQETTTRKNPIMFIKQRKLHFVEFDDDEPI